jgi:hypothetical protein
MSCIINSDTPGKRRTSILKLLANLLPEIKSVNPTQSTRNDIAAFVILSLSEVEKTINDTVIPWEKKGYWTKAQQFGAEWNWALAVKNQLMNAETAKGWTEWPDALEQLEKRLVEIKPTRKKMGAFWEGSYERYKQQKNKK